jgi:hypothetical protein
MRMMSRHDILICDEIDPRFRPGVIIRGNQYARYNVTKQGTEWKIIKVLPDAECGAEPENAVSMAFCFDNLLVLSLGHNNGMGFPVQAACFDFVSDPNLTTNRSALHLLRR